MKTRLLALAFAALPAFAADLSGNWRLEGDIADLHIDRVCTIKQTDTKLSGTCKNQMNTVSLTGDVDGKNVTWTYDSDYQGTKVTVVYKGTLESDTAISGKISAADVAGNFTAKKQ